MSKMRDAKTSLIVLHAFQAPLNDGFRFAPFNFAPKLNIMTEPGIKDV